MISDDQIVWLHVEATSQCNAHCPACPRNNFGFGIKAGLVIQDLSIFNLEAAFDKFKNIKTVQFCGNYGDPIAAKNILEQIDFVIEKNVSKIQIHTNGSLKTTLWWKDLAKKLQNVEHFVEFAIDGLAGIHEIYRQGTSFKKIIDNASAFISAGGIAHWQFIPFNHNQHQIMDCIKLSQTLGFAKFNFVKNARYFDQAYHYQSGKELDIKPWQHDSKMNQLVKKNKNFVFNNNCMHISYPSAFLSAQGHISPCCYFADNIMYNDIDVVSDFDNKLFNKTCLKNCGSTI